MKQMIRRLKCRVGLHDLEGKMCNIKNESGKTVTIGWNECTRCGHSKTTFIYSNWDGVTP
jgi:hypothetical protein